MITPPRKLLQMIAALWSAMGSAHAAPLPLAERPQLGKLFGQLREDAALRARFSLNPRSIFEERGIDPHPYDLPDRLDAADVERFLSNWTGAAGPAARSRSFESRPVPVDTRPEKKLASDSPAATPGDAEASGAVPPPGPAAPAPVYGPPPGLPPPGSRKNLPEPVSPPLPPSQPGPPQTVIYGPPPGFRTKP